MRAPELDKLRYVGFWSMDRRCRGGLIHPTYLGKGGLSPDERAMFIHYLKSGLEVCSWLGFSFCRMPDGPPDQEMGCRDLSDGKWIWPEGLAVYVGQYDIELPEEFVEHARENDFRIPPEVDLPTLKRLALDPECCDESFWRDWCRSRLPKRSWWKLWR